MVAVERETKRKMKMKWFECSGEKVEMIYQPIQARNAASAEKKFRKMYSGVLNVRVKEVVA